MKSNLVFILFLFSISFSNAQEEIDSLAIRTKENTAYYNISKPETKKFKSNFQSKYKGDAYNYQPKLENKQVTAWEKLKKKISDFFSRLFSFSNNGKVFSNFEIFMKILGFGIIGFVIFMIVKLLLNKDAGWVFSRNSKKIKTGTIEEDNIHFINFKDVITSAKLKNEYRIATRYYYLWLLKSLSDKTIINWDIEKTNTDYLSEIKNTELKKEFEFLSYVYDYCWYGEFELTKEDFEKAENHFINAIQNR